MIVNGREILYAPPTWQKTPALGGVPFLAPWANRLDGDSYTANGRRFLLNAGLGNLRFDANHLPIHGLLLFADAWQTIHQEAGVVTSRLEFWRYPQWMAQFPFAHAIEITHRLRDGALEIETAIENLSKEPMPLSIGYHPYLQLTDSPRDRWKLHIAARDQVILSNKMIPTGASRPIEFENPLPLAGQALDTVFTGLTGEEFVLEGPTQRISVRFGEKYPVAVVYAPPHGDFACFEPMTALIDAFNTPGAALPHIAPGETWRESFWIKPSGFREPGGTLTDLAFSRPAEA
jgi:aldose 1-epimerase